MARVTASVYSSHVPAIGVAIDYDKTDEPYWRPLFDGYETGREWIADNTPDVIVLVFNDHATAFGLDIVPTFALGMSAEYQPADEGWGQRPVPPVRGHPELSAHIAHSVIRDDFDLTLVNDVPVDHGCTVPLSIMFGQPDRWPCAVIPLMVNVVQYPVPSGRRCLELGQALRRAIDGFDDDLDVQVWGTGGMSHQLQGPRAGLINPEFDHAFLERMIADPNDLATMDHVEYVREGGSEGIELVMWLVARGAMSDLAGGPPPTEVHRLHHVPASNTAVGQLILENTPLRTTERARPSEIEMPNHQVDVWIRIETAAACSEPGGERSSASQLVRSSMVESRASPPSGSLSHTTLVSSAPASKICAA